MNLTDATLHQLYKQIGKVEAAFAKAASVLTVVIDPLTSAEGWEEIPQVTGDMFCLANRSYIDLEGWARDDLTTFVKGVDVQTPPYVLGMGNVVVFHEFDLLTTRRISDSELANIANLPPGWLSSPNSTSTSQTLDLMQVVYGQYRTQANNANIPGTFITVDRGTFGSGNPSSASKLYWTKLYLVAAVGGATYNGDFKGVPTNLVVQAVTDKESEYVYLERQRRSYVLQETIDA